MKKFDRWTSLVSYASFVAMFYVCILASPIAGSIIPFDSERQKAPNNLDFEVGKLGEFPANWTTTSRRPKSGLSDTQPLKGKKCFEVDGDYVYQTIEANTFRGKRIRFKAAVKVQKNKICQAQLLMDIGVDQAKSKRATPKSLAFYNMHDRPIKNTDWKYHEIVLDVPNDADYITIGCFTNGHGLVWLDNASLEVVDAQSKISSNRALLESKPGVYQIRGVRTVDLRGKRKATLLYPLPLAYRDQSPISYAMRVEPKEAIEKLTVIPKNELNHVLRIELKNAGSKQIKISFQSNVLVGPTHFELPDKIEYPSSWPNDVLQWLLASWCVDSENPRIIEIAKRITRSSGDNLVTVLRASIEESEKILGSAKGSVTHLTATEALDKFGSCTSNANLVAAILRACRIPTRVVSGYPSWSGPLETHYIVESYLPKVGWYPIESSLSLAPFPNSGQVNVSIVAHENEAKQIAGPRPPNAGGVPYLSLVEYESRGIYTTGEIEGPLHEHCPHECKLLNRLESDQATWNLALNNSTKHWKQWLSLNQSGAKTVDFNNNQALEILNN